MTSAEGLCITAVGMVSALGRDVVTSCAAARAGLSQSAELQNMDFGSDQLFGPETLEGLPTIFGHAVRGAGDGFTGVGKALVQGGIALDDLLRRRPLGERERARTGLVVNVSDYFLEDMAASAMKLAEAPSVRWKGLTELLPQRLAESRGLALAVGHHVIHRGGNAGGAAALSDAVARIRQGQLDRCIVAGIDARTDPPFLKAAAHLFQLRMNDNPVGLCPGEAAAFYLVERESDCMRSGFEPLVRVGGSWSARDTTHLLDEAAPPSGSALTDVVEAALVDLGRDGLGRPWYLGDHNGTSRRATEWAHALVRIRATHDVDPRAAWFPATSFGDVGAASAAVAICCVCRAHERGYAKQASALVWSSSESGTKGAITLTRAESR